MGERLLEGKTALITGAAKRIGRETALTLAEAGANIIVHYHGSTDEAEELVDEISSFGVDAWTLQADFAEQIAYEGLIGQALQLAGRLDILVNNASIFPAETLEEVTWESLQRNLEINAWAPFVLCRAFAAHVGQGHIVNLLDSRLTGYDWHHIGYIISKHAFAEFTRMAALAYAPAVAINGVAPGLILPPPGKDISYIEKLTDTVPLKRHGNPQDIADAVLFLVTSNFLCGEVIYVDGGRHLKEYRHG